MFNIHEGSIHAWHLGTTDPSISHFSDNGEKGSAIAAVGPRGLAGGHGGDNSLTMPELSGNARAERECQSFTPVTS